MATTRIPNQKLDTLMDTKTLVAAYNTRTGGVKLREGIVKFIQVEGYDALKTVLTATLAAIPAKNPVNLDAGGVIWPQVPTLGIVVNAVHSHWDGIPKPTITYQWKRGASNIAGATASQYIPVLADIGTTLSCVITATNTGGSATETLTAAAVVADNTHLPHNTVAPAVTGTATTTHTLTTTNGTWTGDATIAFSYQWMRDAVAIAGATAITYVVATADITHALSCVVTGTNGVGAEAAASNATATVAS